MTEKRYKNTYTNTFDHGIIKSMKVREEFDMTVNRISDLFTLCGSFGLPVGEIERTEDGYRYVGEGYEALSTVQNHSSGVNCRRDSIRNTSDQPITLRAALSKFTFYGGEYEVYTQYSEWCNENMGAWQPLVTEISAANDDIRMNSGANPFVAIYNQQNHRGMAFHVLADSTWRFRVKKQFYQGKGRQRSVYVELGINDRGFEYVLQPGEMLELPEILYYEFENKTDMDAYRLHRYCNEVYPARSMPVIYNSWLSRADNISYELLSEQLEVAKRLGVDYFVIDAGWFGAPGEWMDSVGDWEECTHCSMRGRMREFADKVRETGLKFGLWFEVERAAMASRAVANYPQYYICEDGNCFLDFSNPEASDYMFDILSAQIRKYGIEFIKFDFNAAITFDRHRHAFLDYFRGYRAFIDRLGREFPNLYFESCASGGLRMALANLRGFDSFWMSDNHSLYTQLEIYKNTILRMPCRALEKWITVQSLPYIQGRLKPNKNCEKILASGDAGWKHVEAIFESFLTTASVGGPMGISCDLTALSDRLVDTLAAHIAHYKTESKFWMGAECRILTDTPTMLALQFSDAGLDEIKIFVYAKRPCQYNVTVYPVCNAETRYTNAAGEIIDGKDLMRDGIDLLLEKEDTYNGYSILLKKI